jgi:hypothetical protein
MNKPSKKVPSNKIETLPANWSELPLEAKYDFVNKKLHKLADIDCDWAIDIKLQSGGNGKNYSSYIEWTDSGCVLDSDYSSYKHCQFVRTKPILLEDFSLSDFPQEIQNEFKDEDWSGEYDYDIPNIFDSAVSGKNWTECLEKIFYRLELLKIGYKMCWELEEYREDNRDFFKKHFEELDDIFGDDEDDDVDIDDFDIGDIDFENIDLTNL